MKIAFVTSYDATNIGMWSGISSHILEALKKQGMQVAPIGPLTDPEPFWLRMGFFARGLWATRVERKCYSGRYDPGKNRRYAHEIERKLAAIQPDLIFALETHPMAFVETDKPIVLYGDATFPALTRNYPEYGNFCRYTLHHGRQLEALSLRKCALAVYATEWAVKCASEDYGINSEITRIVPFGANLECHRLEQDVEKLLRRREQTPLRILLIGVDWERKGAETAFRVVEELNRRGTATDMTIIGCNPPPGFSAPPWLKVTGFISKKTKEGRSEIERELTRSHFLILPAQAECSGVVFCEANSFGVPCLASDAGGIPWVVKAGKNGKTFPVGSPASIYCDYVEDLAKHPEAYHALAMSSFREFRTRLNWDAAGSALVRLFEYCLGSRAAL